MPDRGLTTMPVTRVGFGGGCHWCTEAVFQSVRGVERVEQGFIASTAPHDTWSEAVIVHYDADAVALSVLIEAHLHTHASTSAHSMRRRYRSAIYCFDAAQAQQAETELTRLQTDFNAALVTQVLPYAAFKASDSRFKNYYANNSGRPFCRAYISPKLLRLAEHLPESFRTIYTG